jgi:hypothetical protein
VNIHLIVNPADAGHVDKIKHALGRLHFRYCGQNYSCSDQQLTELGIAVAGLSSPEKNLRDGINQFKPSFDVFEDWLRMKPGCGTTLLSLHLTAQETESPGSATMVFLLSGRTSITWLMRFFLVTRIVSTFRDAAATAGLTSSVNTASYSPAFTVRMHMD